MFSDENIHDTVLSIDDQLDYIVHGSVYDWPPNNNNVPEHNFTCMPTVYYICVNML